MFLQQMKILNVQSASSVALVSLHPPQHVKQDFLSIILTFMCIQTFYMGHIWGTYGFYMEHYMAKIGILIYGFYMAIYYPYYHIYNQIKLYGYYMDLYGFHMELYGNIYRHIKPY